MGNAKGHSSIVMKSNISIPKDRTILFVATHPSAPGEYTRVARRLQTRGYNVVICLATPTAMGNVPLDQRDVVQYSSIEGNPINWTATDAAADTLKLQKNNNIIRRVLAYFSRFPVLKGLVTSIRLLRSLISERSSVSLLFTRIQPNVIVIPGDRQPRLEATIAELSHQYDIPLICAPTCQIAAPATLAQHRATVPINKITRFFIPIYWLSKLIPSQTHTTEEKTVNFYTPITAFLLLLMGVLPRNPFQMGGGGRADCLLVHGEADKDLQVAAGLPPKNAFVLGQPSSDLLHDQLVRKPQRIGIASLIGGAFLSDRSTAVFAVPQPFAEAPNWTRSSLISVRDSLITAGYNVVLSIHPKQRVENYKHMELDGYAYLASAPLVSFLGYSDLYISSYSSTVRWAMLSALPLAVVDYHEENCRIFDDLPMIPILRSGIALEAWLLEMKDATNKAKLSEKLRAVSSYYQCFDGRSTDRVVMKIIEIISKKRSATTAC
jgi:hypothetical protein